MTERPIIKRCEHPYWSAIAKEVAVALASRNLPLGPDAPRIIARVAADTADAIFAEVERRDAEDVKREAEITAKKLAEMKERFPEGCEVEVERYYGERQRGHVRDWRPINNELYVEVSKGYASWFEVERVTRVPEEE